MNHRSKVKAKLRKTIKLKEDNIGETLNDIWFYNDFLDKTQGYNP